MPRVLPEPPKGLREGAGAERAGLGPLLRGSAEETVGLTTRAWLLDAGCCRPVLEHLRERLLRVDQDSGWLSH